MLTSSETEGIINNIISINETQSHSDIDEENWTNDQIANIHKTSATINNDDGKAPKDNAKSFNWDN